MRNYRHTFFFGLIFVFVLFCFVDSLILFCDATKCSLASIFFFESRKKNRLLRHFIYHMSSETVSSITSRKKKHYSLIQINANGDTVNGIFGNVNKNKQPLADWDDLNKKKNDKCANSLVTSFIRFYSFNFCQHIAIEHFNFMRSDEINVNEYKKISSPKQ